MFLFKLYTYFSSLQFNEWTLTFFTGYLNNLQNFTSNFRFLLKHKLLLTRKKELRAIAFKIFYFSKIHFDNIENILFDITMKIYLFFNVKNILLDNFKKYLYCCLLFNKCVCWAIFLVLVFNYCTVEKKYFIWKSKRGIYIRRLSQFNDNFSFKYKVKDVKKKYYKKWLGVKPPNICITLFLQLPNTV